MAKIAKRRTKMDESVLDLSQARPRVPAPNGCRSVAWLARSMIAILHDFAAR